MAPAASLAGSPSSSSIGARRPAWGGGTDSWSKFPEPAGEGPLWSGQVLRAVGVDDLRVGRVPGRAERRDTHSFVAGQSANKEGVLSACVLAQWMQTGMAELSVGHLPSLTRWSLPNLGLLILYLLKQHRCSAPARVN